MGGQCSPWPRLPEGNGAPASSSHNTRQGRPPQHWSAWESPTWGCRIWEGFGGRPHSSSDLEVFLNAAQLAFQGGHSLVEGGDGFILRLGGKSLVDLDAVENEEMLPSTSSKRGGPLDVSLARADDDAAPSQVIQAGETAVRQVQLIPG